MTIRELIGRLSHFPESTEVTVITDEDMNDRYDIEDVILVTSGENRTFAVISTDWILEG